MKRSFMMSVGCLAAFALLALVSCASNGGGVPQAGVGVQAAEKTEFAAPSEELAALQVANNLARFGYSTRSASALIGAAEIFAQTQTQPLDVQVEASEGVVDEAVAPEFTPESLLADARRFAGNDSTMLAWAAEVERMLEVRTRGAVGGPQVGWGRLPSRQTLTYFISFQAGRRAEVLVVGDGSTILDIFIYDQHGNLVTFTDVWTTDAFISWVPSRTGTFQVVVKNWGPRTNHFEIFTN